MKTIIVGGGASGVICALKLKTLNKDIEVIILEQNDKLLKKLLKTGNGKCNISNKEIKSEFYNDYSLIENSKIDIINELESLGIILKSIDNRLYPYSESSTTVINTFLNKIKELEIKVILNYEVKKIHKKDIFYINDDLTCDYLVIASGSCAQEKTTGYQICKNIGLEVTPLSPGLVPFETIESTASLNGLRVKCACRFNDKILNGEILFKSNGLSGILALDISRFITENDVIYLDLMPDYSKEKLDEILVNKNILDNLFPKMIVNDLKKRMKNRRISDVIKNYEFTVKRKLDFKHAQIVLGGVKGVKSTFESKIRNLYVVGEILDVDGSCGGYNLHFALLSGITCAFSIIKNISCI